jgi:hypothetical protein
MCFKSHQSALDKSLIEWQLSSSETNLLSHLLKEEKVNCFKMKEERLERVMVACKAAASFGDPCRKLALADKA